MKAKVKTNSKNKSFGEQIVLIELGFIKRFLYALILNDLFKNVKSFTNFLTNFIERRGDMSLQKQKPDTIDSLLESINAVIYGIEHIGGYNSLNDYGRGQYDMMTRMKRKLDNIQKASEDARDDDNLEA